MFELIALKALIPSSVGEQLEWTGDHTCWDVVWTRTRFSVLWDQRDFPAARDDHSSQRSVRVERLSLYQ